MIVHADSLEYLKTLPDASVDAVVTDPPYGLGPRPPILDVLRAWVAGEVYRPKGGGFMGKKWDAFVPGPEIWRECFRVLKPGGHLLAFFGTRTYHLGTLAVEIAGFEVRDLIAWLYGTGFPKSLDVSKAIDKAAGAEREVLGEGAAACEYIRRGEKCPGHGDAGKSQSGATIHAPATAPATPEAAEWEGWGTALKPALEPVVVARKPLEGTVAANVLSHGTGAFNVDGCRIEAEKATGWGGGAAGGRWPANVALDEEAAEALDAQAGERKSGSRAPGVRKGLGYHGAQGDGGPAIQGSSGGASRFFYVAKASKAERDAGLTGMPTGRNTHPTVKPLALMRWLVRLVTPPGGLVLDPFAGSGTTGLAAHAEGFRFLGIEREAEYVEEARARLEAAGAEC